MSFRGQVREFFIHRPIPNPFMVIPQKGERLIVPSLYRPLIGQPFSDERLQYDKSLLVSMQGDDLIYYGIPDYATLPLRNFEKYGIHTMSDLADFPDADSREYYHRWQKHKMGFRSREVPLLEQHYGIDTAGLDVTFDLKTALFFATNQFVFLDKEKYIATYTPIPKGQHEGIVYCLVFRDPKITKSRDKINQIGMFQHIPPVRPIRQSCAIPFFSSMEINAAVTDLHAIFILDKDFDTRGLPKKEYLFPDIHRDPFYKALLDTKKKKPDILGKIVEYKF